MLAVNTNEAFVVAVEAARSVFRKDDFEPIIIDTMPLRHNRVTGILMGGLGPDYDAPCLYRPWSNSDFAGGIYNHHVSPKWYVSPSFVEKYKSTRFYKLIEKYFNGIIDLDKPESVLRAIWHIAA